MLLWSQLKDDSLREALRGTVAGIVGMVPEGLVLLTSIAFMVGALTLASRKVLVQELPAVEGLARVDVVCLDKTGTLTEGEIVYDATESLDGSDAAPALGALAADENRNGTLAALSAAFDSPGWRRTAAVPFSSARKWSAASFEGQGTWVMGAPEMVLPDASSSGTAAGQRDRGRGSAGARARGSDASLDGEGLPPGLESRRRW